MYAEDFFPFVQVGQFDMNLAIEASRTQKCLIEHIGAVRGGEDDDTAVRAEAVHLSQ